MKNFLLLLPLIIILLIALFMVVYFSVKKRVHFKVSHKRDTQTKKYKRKATVCCSNRVISIEGEQSLVEDEVLSTSAGFAVYQKINKTIPVVGSIRLYEEWYYDNKSYEEWRKSVVALELPIGEEN